jgi:uncharacterized SAM-binding protein YcdF (DUF218 family)
MHVSQMRDRVHHNVSGAIRVPVKTMATALLVPPVSLLLVAVIGLLIEHRSRGHRSRGLGRRLTWCAAIGLIALAMPVVGSSLLVALETNLPLTPSPDAPPQAIVILGGNLTRSARALHLGALSLERVRAGAALSRRTALPILVSGGLLREGDPPVSALMAASLIHDFHVPVRWIETASSDTWENAHMSAAILREEGIGSIYVVTHAWHLRRAIMAFTAAGMRVTAAPPWLDRLAISLADDFVPDPVGWQASYRAMHEWIGNAYYALRLKRSQVQ